ncbi:MAG TPA: hypothetical protein PKG48_01765 [Bacteroidales bacterium]|nr:hypothetical protein [Bacteroidales bacterium]HPS61785.1 hypothetical protein [Bacteroidales bacterium]
MNNTTEKYSPEEILQLLKDFYNFQTQFDPEVESGEELTFYTTIADWRMICDLVSPMKLAKVHHEFFELKSSITELEDILYFEEKNTLRDFCEYIAKNASKEKIHPIITLGQSCMSAAIFKTLMTNLNKRGVNTDSIKPSSNFVPLFDKYAIELLEEVNKIAPGSLTKFEYRNNIIVRTGSMILLISILSIIVVSLFWHFHMSLLILSFLGLVVIFIGKLFKPEKNIIGGYNTMRDLVIGIQEQLEKAAT